MKKTSFLFLLCFFLSIVHIQSAPNAPQPDQIIQLFRHGARGPLNPYDPDWTIDQYGVLTPVGLRQQYILGKVLSEKYSNLFSADYNYNHISMLSDTTPRCIQSATTQFFGLYQNKGPALKKNYPPLLAVPPFEDDRVQKLANSLPNAEAVPKNFIPNIVNIVDDSAAQIFQGDSSSYCPNNNKWVQQNTNDLKTQVGWTAFKPTIDNINQYLEDDMKLKKPGDVLGYGDSLLVNIADNRTFPGGYNNSQLATNLTFAYNWFNSHIYHGQQDQRQLGAYHLVREVMNQLIAFRAGKDYKKVVLLSGHDSNLYAWLSAFGILTDECIMANFLASIAKLPTPFPNCNYPFFASNIIVEFYNQTTNPYVKFLYNNNVVKLCKGQETCSLNDFIVFADLATGMNTEQTYKQKCGAPAAKKEKVEFAVLSAQQTIEDSLFFKDGNLNVKRVALIGMGLLCLLLCIPLISNKKKYQTLFDEANMSGYKPIDMRVSRLHN